DLHRLLQVKRCEDYNNRDQKEHQRTDNKRPGWSCSRLPNDLDLSTLDRSDLSLLKSFRPTLCRIIVGLAILGLRIGRRDRLGGGRRSRLCIRNGPATVITE